MVEFVPEGISTQTHFYCGTSIQVVNGDIYFGGNVTSNKEITFNGQLNQIGVFSCGGQATFYKNIKCSSGSGLDADGGVVGRGGVFDGNNSRCWSPNNTSTGSGFKPRTWWLGAGQAVWCNAAME